ncbi:hypothetical protein MEO94_30955 [Dolichospermum sp. ST_sed9]|nr:hypothetical protein [Dolichospermum sp. ST_sed9]
MNYKTLVVRAFCPLDMYLITPESAVYTSQALNLSFCLKGTYGCKNASLDIQILCVEFDEGFKPLDNSYKLRIRHCVNKLLDAGFYLIYSQGNGNYTFVNKND